MKEIQSNGKVSELLHDVSIPKMFHADIPKRDDTTGGHSGSGKS